MDINSCDSVNPWLCVCYVEIYVFCSAIEMDVLWLKFFGVESFCEFVRCKEEEGCKVR